MKRIDMRLISIMMVCFVLVPNLFACKKEDASVPIPMVDILRDGATDYVIVNQSADPIGSYLADGVWGLIYSTYGVSMEKKSDSTHYDCEIVIGNAAREKVSELQAKLEGAGNFVILQEGNRLYLYANTFEGSRRMLVALRDHFIPACEENTLQFEESLCFVSHDHPEVETDGVALTLFADGKTDYTIVYDNRKEQDEAIAYYLRRAIEDASGIKLSVSDYRNSDSEYEIVIGSGTLEHSEYAAVRRTLKGNEQFVLAVSGTRLILTATDAKALIQGAEYLNLTHIQSTVNGICAVYEADEVRSHLDNKGFSLSYERLSALYIDVLGFYPTLYDLYYDKTVSGTSKSDQQIVEAVVECLGVGFVLRDGSSSMLHDGKICKLDGSDYSRCAQLSQSDPKVPAAFVNGYFGTSYSLEQEVDVKNVAENAGYSYYYDGVRKIAILMPVGGVNFADDAAKNGEYTNGQLKNRMAAFFDNSAMPEPKNNTEQSRVVIGDATDYYPEDAYDYTMPTYTCYYSPGILAVGETIYTSVEHCQVRDGDELNSKTVIRKSTDGGETWEVTHEVERLKWASMFLVGEDIYIVGFLKDAKTWSGGMWIGQIVDDGNSKTTETVKLFKLWDDVSAIFEPLVVDGILYLPLDTTVASISVEHDLTVPENWTRTQDSETLISRSWFQNLTGKTLDDLGTAECLEGNIVRGKDGKIYVIYRIESQPHGNYAVMLEVSEDRTRLNLLPDNGSLLDLPTTVSRFVIKYDESIQKYICISNWYLTKNACRARNVLGISVSDDLVVWTQVDTLLVERDMINTECSCWKTAFQYVDWDFDGEDLVLAVRETVGYSNTFHDGKYFTFYRVSNYRSLLQTN